MLIPRIAPGTALDAPLQRALDLLPATLYSDAQQAIAAGTAGDADAWAEAGATDDVKGLLNSGLAVAVMAASPKATVDGIAASRIALRYAADATQSVAQLLSTVLSDGIERAGAVIVQLSADQIIQATQPSEGAKKSALALLVRAAEARVPAGGDEPVRVAVEMAAGDAWTTELLGCVARAGADSIVEADQLALEGGKLTLGDAFVAASGLASDRADGLITTVVVDEQRVCLGVAYSNGASITAALAAAQGVYWSRRRGLWHKGLTSGATQTLVGVAVDCDADALCFRVRQSGAGFCHRGTRTCFGPAAGVGRLARMAAERREQAPEGSYTKRLFDDSALLRAKLLEEAGELADATSKEDVAFEAADLLYFAMVKCAAHGVTLADVERNLDQKHRKVVRRPGNAKPGAIAEALKDQAVKDQTAKAQLKTSILSADIRPPKPGEQICMRTFADDELTGDERSALLQRPIIDSGEIMKRVQPIVDAVRTRGDAALRELTEKFDGAQLESPVVRAPFDVPKLAPAVRAAIDQAYANVHMFHAAQLGKDTHVETMPGVLCSRFSRAIERVGLYVPGGTAVLPSSALMLGVPAQVAGCREIVLATPPRANGSIAPEVLYVAHKVGASAIVKAGGAQAIAAMAYGTESVPKVDKICGPGNQYVTAAKMLAQNDTAAMVAIDMPAGPSEVLVIADASSNPKYVASDLLSQAEHGPDSQVVLLAVGLDDAQMEAMHAQIHDQAERLPRVDIVRQSIPKSYCLRVADLPTALAFSNAYGPEHLILHNASARDCLPSVVNAGSVFVGPYSPESCGDYASGTNHTLPTYGFSKMYSGVNTGSFLKHITSQELTREGLINIGQTVMTLAEVEGLEAHRNAVAIRLNDIAPPV
ncbi:trifunctional histidinol dehydrogenase [Coemansia sp. RSA 552]|nr:trifunctional histidinol dehydrogenase [Coemansia sp. RSA 552]